MEVKIIYVAGSWGGVGLSVQVKKQALGDRTFDSSNTREKQKVSRVEDGHERVKTLWELLTNASSFFCEERDRVIF